MIYVNITAYDRLDLFKECLERVYDSLLSWSKSCPIGIAGNGQINIFLDGASEFTNVKIDSWVYGHNTVKLHPLEGSQRLGADLNILRSLSDFTQVKSSFHYVIKLDSDVMVSRNFVHDMVMLASKFDGIATSNLYGKDPLDVKMANSHNITKWAMSGANFCVSLENLNKLLPMATALIKTYKQNGHNPATTAEEWKVMKDLLRLYAPLHNEMNSPHRDFLLNSDVPNTGSDAMIAVAAWCHGIPIVSYAVNRAIHPSDTGVNTTKEFHAQHYAGVTLDELPPADPAKFKFV